jgi:hypothetical protein
MVCGLNVDPEDGGAIFLRNFRLPQNNTVLKLKELLLLLLLIWRCSPYRALASSLRDSVILHI